MARFLWVQGRLQLLNVIALTALIVFSVFAFTIINRIKVTGPLYNDIAVGKDLIADILPPPTLLNEHYLAVLQMSDEKNPGKLARDMRYCVKLRDDYMARISYWQNRLGSSSIGEQYIDDVNQPALRFLLTAHDELFPMLRRGEREQARELINGRLKELYVQHRQSAERVAGMLQQRNEELEIHTRQMVRQGTLWIGVGGAIIALLTALLSMVVGRSISAPLRSVAQAMTEYANGARGTRITIYGKDEITQVALAFNNLANTVEQDETELQQRIHEIHQAHTDITVQARDLEDALRAAQAASRAKSDFLANMSHELRTPLSAMIGYTDMIEQTAPALDEIQPHIRAIRSSGEHLLSIIADMLDLGRIEAGKFQLETANVSPRTLIEEAVEMHRLRAAGKNLELSVQWPRSLPEAIRTDPTRLRQILANLVGNAVKFTSNGSVRVDVQVDQAVMGDCRLTVAVTDSGPGISSQTLTKLFRPFVQADETTSRRFGGAGLGLAISQRLAEAMGGYISVASEVDKGSTFTLSLTVPCTHLIVKRGSSSLAPDTLKGYRILLVEDGVDNQRIIQFMLTRLGATVDLAENGRIGMVAALAAQERGQAYDVILMDVQMPEMDGYTAAAELRKAHYTAPIIAVTAHAMSHDRQKCLDCGCDDYETKPVSRERLVAAIQRVTAPAVLKIAA